MKHLITFCLFGVLALPVQAIRAQEKPADRPKSEEHPKPAIPLKVQIVFSEMDGEKKIAVMPYSFLAVADERISGPYGPSTTSLRTGVRVPVEVDGKDQKTTYMDVGANIDCGVRAVDEGRFHVYLSFDRSALYANKSEEGERLVTQPNGQPLVRQFRVSENLVLRDGQTSENVLSTDPLTGHVLKIAVTINVQR